MLKINSRPRNAIRYVSTGSSAGSSIRAIALTFPAPRSNENLAKRHSGATFTPHFCALSSAVEHFLHTEGVAGSNPAARTIQPPLLGPETPFYLLPLDRARLRPPFL